MIEKEARASVALDGETQAIDEHVHDFRPFQEYAPGRWLYRCALCSEVGYPIFDPSPAALQVLDWKARLVREWHDLMTPLPKGR